MQTILDLLNTPSLLPELVLIGVLCWVGGSMTFDRPDLVAWSYRIAAGVFVVYCGYAIVEFEPQDADEFLWVVVRGLLGAGLFGLGCSRIILAVVGFIHHHFVQRVRSSWQQRANERFDEDRERHQLSLRMARRDSQASAVTTIVEQPVARIETVGDMVAKERRDHEDRVAAINELQASGVIDAEMCEELNVNELERYTRRLTNVLGYRAEQ